MGFMDWLRGEEPQDIGVPIRAAAEDVVTAAALPLLGENARELYSDKYDLDRSLSLILNSGDGVSEQAWHFFRTVPELHYLATLLANSVSKVDLFAARLENGEPVRLDAGHPASKKLAEWAGGHQGQSEVLGRIATHLVVVGDSVLIGPADGVDLPYPFDAWRVFSAGEVYASSGKVFVRTSNSGLGYKDQQVPDGAEVIRIWKPAPDAYWKADSAVLAAFGVLGEIELLDAHIRSTALSRLRGAGILAIPEEITLPGSEEAVEGEESDPFIRSLVEVMALAIKDPASAAALVPIIIRGPAEFIDKIKHLDFSTLFDAQVVELRDAAIRRLALGLDSPPEILLGSAEASSWSAWQVAASNIDSHVKPLGNLIASSLSAGGILSEWSDEGVVVWADFTELRVITDLGADLQAAHDRGLITDEAFIRELGLNVEEIPGKKEVAYQLLIGLVKSKDPVLSPWAVEELKKSHGVPFESLPEQGGDSGTGGGGNASGIADTGQAPVIPGKRSAAKQDGAPPTAKEIASNGRNEPGGVGG